MEVIVGIPSFPGLPDPQVGHTLECVVYEEMIEPTVKVLLCRPVEYPTVLIGAAFRPYEVTPVKGQKGVLTLTVALTGDKFWQLSW